MKHDLKRKVIYFFVINVFIYSAFERLLLAELTRGAETGLLTQAHVTIVQCTV